jgi:hypothetical protein
MAWAMVLANGVDHCRAGTVDHLIVVDSFHPGLLHTNGREHLKSALPATTLILLSFEESLQLTRHWVSRRPRRNKACHDDGDMTRSRATVLNPQLAATATAFLNHLLT